LPARPALPELPALPDLPDLPDLPAEELLERFDITFRQRLEPLQARDVPLLHGLAGTREIEVHRLLPARDVAAKAEALARLLPFQRIEAAVDGARAREQLIDVGLELVEVDGNAAACG